MRTRSRYPKSTRKRALDHHGHFYGTDDSAWNVASSGSTKKQRHRIYKVAKFLDSLISPPNSKPSIGCNYNVNQIRPSYVSPALSTSKRKSKLVLHKQKHFFFRKTVLDFYSDIPASIITVAKVVTPRIGRIILSTIKASPQFTDIYALFKVVKVSIVFKRIAVSLQDFSDNASKTIDLFIYDENGYSGIKESTYSLVRTIQSGEEFIDNMRELSNELGLSFPINAKPDSFSQTAQSNKSSAK